MKLVALVAVGLLSLAPVAAAAQKPVTQVQFKRLARVVKQQKTQLAKQRARIDNLIEAHNELVGTVRDLGTAHNGLVQGVSDLSARHSGLATFTFSLSDTVKALGDLVVCHVAQPSHGGPC